MGLITCRYVPGPDNDADIFTKNVTAAIFEKHISKFVGVDEYMKEWADTQRLDTSKYQIGLLTRYLVGSVQALDVSPFSHVLIHTHKLWDVLLK